MANLVYNKCLSQIANGGTDLDTSDLRLLLTTASYTPNKDHEFVDDITNEIAVSGYGRVALTSETVTQDDTNDFAYLDADDVVFSGLASGETARYAVLFRHTGSDATAPLLALYDLGGIPTAVGSITVIWNTPANGGVLKLTG